MDGVYTDSFGAAKVALDRLEACISCPK